MSDQLVPVEDQLVGEAEHFDLPDHEVDVEALLEAAGEEVVWAVDASDLAPDPDSSGEAGDAEEVPA